MTTARDICNSILRKLHVLGRGQIIPDDQLNDVLNNINNMLATWSIEGSLVYTQSSETFSLTSGQATYTIGSGQDFDTTRILDIVSAFTSQGETDYPLQSYNQTQYNYIENKNIGGIPEVYYFDGGYSVSNISLFPVPSGVTTITLNTKKQLDGFVDLDTVYALPPEYEAAIIYNAAIWIAPEYEKEPTRGVINIANRTKKAIETQNRRNDRKISYLNVPAAENQRYEGDILRGY